MDIVIQESFVCSFCGYDEYDDISVEHNGAWCADCDSFTYFPSSVDRRNHFTLIMEQKDKSVRRKGNTRKKNWSAQLSPYRYPGGKSKLIAVLLEYLKENRCQTLYSPFSGGASFELAMLHSGVVRKLMLNDRDTGVFSFWWVVKHAPDFLIHRLATANPSHEDYFSAQQLIKNDYQGADVFEAAWASILVNRLAFSGIYKANPLGGKKGSREELLSRWNAKTLIRRIKEVHRLSDGIEVHQVDALEFIEDAYWDHKATIFIDPPYVNKGKDLYHCYYEKDDHLNLALLLDQLFSGYCGADLVLTYDDSDYIDRIYDYPSIVKVARYYSA